MCVRDKATFPLSAFGELQRNSLNNGIKMERKNGKTRQTRQADLESALDELIKQILEASLFRVAQSELL